MKENMLLPQIRRYVGKAYLRQYRARAGLHWVVSSLLGFIPSFLIVAYSKSTWVRHMDWYLYGAIVVGFFWGFGFLAYVNGLSLTLRGRRIVNLHLPRGFILTLRHQRPTEQFAASAAAAILWARQAGITTVTMDSPLLHKSRRRNRIAVDLQRACGSRAVVTPVASLRRLTLFQHLAFMLPRRKSVNFILSKAPFTCWRNWAVPARHPDGLSREQGRLISGRIIVTLDSMTEPARSPESKMSPKA